MPLATADEVAEFIAEGGPIRLGCRHCWRDDLHYGINLIPPGWSDVEEWQTLQEALSVYGGGDDDPEPDGYSVMDWWTHLGTCPECSLAGCGK